MAKISRSKPRYAGALKWLEGEDSSIVLGLQWSEHTYRSHLFRARTGLWSWALEMTTNWGAQLGFRDHYREFQGNDAAFSVAFFGNFWRKNQRNLQKILVKL